MTQFHNGLSATCSPFAAFIAGADTAVSQRPGNADQHLDAGQAHVPPAHLARLSAVALASVAGLVVASLAFVA